jgi:uncharacterized protein (DUF433 family)
MTIKWVKVDPLVRNGEPFLYNSRLTVRQLLELRASGYTLVDLLKDHPELRTMGVAAAFCYAADHRGYAEYFERRRFPRGARLHRGRGRRATPASPGAGIVVKGGLTAGQADRPRVGRRPPSGQFRPRCYDFRACPVMR